MRLQLWIRNFFLLICLSTSLGCAHLKSDRQHAAIQYQGSAPYFGNSKVHRYLLSNGLKVLILEDHSAPVFAYQTWYNVGSRDEQPGLTGLAHLFEHMMFKATKNHPDGELDRLLEAAGAEGENAFTSQDFTAYVQSLPSNKLDLIVQLEADRMQNLIVDDKVLDKEREVVQNERRFRNENNPNGQLIERIYALSYRKHSYRWPVIGYDEDLKRAKSKQCLDFYKRFYAPNNATVVLVGDVHHHDAIETIQKYYGSLPSSLIDRKDPAVEPVQKNERKELKKIKSEVEKIIIGYHIPNVTDPDYPGLQVLRNILGGGRSSRLYKALVDTGLATGIGLESSEQKDPALFFIFVTMQKGKKAQQVLPAIDKEIRKIIIGQTTQDEINKAVSMYRFSIFDDQTSAMSKAQFIGYYETISGNFQQGVRVVDSLKKIDSSILAELARKYLKKVNRNIVIGSKGDSK